MRRGWRRSERTGWFRGSFVPPEPIRQLRDLTRTRTTMVRARAKEIQRLEKLLEDAGIKLSSVATDGCRVPDSIRATVETGTRTASETLH